MPQATAPFPWPGSKGQLANWVLDVFPQHSTYLDLFGGAGSLLFEKAPAKSEIYNDADADLVQFMTILRDSPEDLICRLRSIPYARDLHTDWATAFFNGHRPDDGVERAARYYFIRRSQYGGEAAQKVGFRATVDGRRNPARHWANSIDRLPTFSTRLQDVRIECEDYDTLLADLDLQTDSTLVYCDPPYPNSSHRYDLAGSDDTPGQQTVPSFRFESFAERIKTLATHRDALYVVVSTDTIPPGLEALYCLSKDSSFAMNAVNGTKSTTEHLLTNFDPETVGSHTENKSLNAF
jgi:DNA adenine methylase